MCCTIFYRQSSKEVAELLSKMSLKSKVKNNDKLEIEIPPTRHDVIHSCDIYEDIAIAYGYNNIKKTIPHVSTIAAEVNLRNFRLNTILCINIPFMYI